VETLGAAEGCEAFTVQVANEMREGERVDGGVDHGTVLARGFLVVCARLAGDEDDGRWSLADGAGEDVRHPERGPASPPELEHDHVRVGRAGGARELRRDRHGHDGA